MKRQRIYGGLILSGLILLGFAYAGVAPGTETATFAVQ